MPTVVSTLLPFSATPKESFLRFFFFFFLINAIQPKCSFSPFLPVMISQKYWLPEMENSFLISQTMVVFKVPPICRVLKISIENRQAHSAEATGSRKPETLGGIEELWRWCCWQGEQCVLTGFEEGPLVCPESRHGYSPTGRRKSRKLPTSPRGFLGVLESIPMPYDSWASLASDPKFPSISITLSDSVE